MKPDQPSVVPTPETSAQGLLPDPSVDTTETNSISTRRSLIAKSLIGAVGAAAVLGRDKAEAATFTYNTGTTVDTYADLVTQIANPNCYHLYLKGNINFPYGSTLNITKPGFKIHGLGQSKIVCPGGNRAFTISADDVEINSVTFDGTPNGANPRGTALSVNTNVKNARILNCRFLNCGGTDWTGSPVLALAGVTRLSIIGNIFENTVAQNAITVNANVASPGSPNPARDILISENIINGTTLSANQYEGNGIWIGHSDGVTCSNNRISNIGRIGIELFYTHRGVVENNHVIDVASMGISMGNSNNSVVVGNAVRNILKPGFYIGIELVGQNLRCDSNLIENEHATPATCGISIDSDAGPELPTQADVLGNTIRGVKNFGIQLYKYTTDCTIQGNHFFMSVYGTVYGRAVLVNVGNPVSTHQRVIIKGNVVKGACDGCFYIFGGDAVIQDNVQYAVPFVGETSTVNNLVYINGGQARVDYTGTVYSAPGWGPNGLNLRVNI